MKKMLTVCCALALFLASLSLGGIGVVSAADPQEGGLYYTVADGNATITGFIRSYKPTAIPATIGGYPVTAIGSAALYGCTSLTAITIPSSVKTIERNAFGACTNLTSVTVKNGVTTIVGGAFYGCTKLTTISLPDSITSIGSQAFYNTPYYDSVGNWTGALLYIGNHLVDAKSWTSGEQTVRAGTKTIAEAAFYGCTELSAVSLPNGLVTIGSQAFQDCDTLDNIQIPSSVQTIGAKAFYSCDGLQDIPIPNGVQTIGAEAFASCVSAQSLTLPSSVTAIGDKAFAYNRSLLYIAVAYDNPVYHSRGNCLIETATNTLLVGCRNSTIPDDGSVTHIAAYAFASQKSLHIFTIPESVTHIYGYAFHSCSALTQLSIPTTLTFIGSYAFDGCDALADIYYGGDQAAWTTLVRGEASNSPLKTARVHYHTLVPHWVLTDILEEPTCTEYGQGLYTCDCGHSLEQALSPKGHPGYEPVETISPTCSTVGYTVYQCTACEDRYQADFVGTAHTFEENACIWCGWTVDACLSMNAAYTDTEKSAWVVRQSGAVKLELSFSEDTVLDGGDTLSIYTAQDELVGAFADDELAGQTVEILGDTAVICLHTISPESTSAFAVAQVTPVAPSLGDLNRDATIDMKDAFSLYRAASGAAIMDDAQKALADMNGDGEYDMRDAFAIYRIASGG